METGTIIFDPLLPWPSLIAGVCLAAVFLFLAIWRGLRGWWLRGLALATLLFAIANPSLQTEDREALSDIVILVVDESASQRVSDRAVQVDEAVAELEAEVARLPNTELRTIRLADADENRGTLLMEALSQAMAEEPRARLAGAKPGDGAWDMKSGPGRLQDIALLAQTGALLGGAPARSVADQLAQGQGSLGRSDADCATLIATEALLWHCQAAARLMTATAFDADAVGAGGRAFLRRGTGADDIGALTTLLEDRTTAAAAIIAAALDKESASDMDG